MASDAPLRGFRGSRICGSSCPPYRYTCRRGRGNTSAHPARNRHSARTTWRQMRRFGDFAAQEFAEALARHIDIRAVAVEEIHRHIQRVTDIALERHAVRCAASGISRLKNLRKLLPAISIYVPSR